MRTLAASAFVQPVVLSPCFNRCHDGLLPPLHARTSLSPVDVASPYSVESTPPFLSMVNIDEPDTSSLLDAVLHQPIFWSVIVMTTIVGLLFFWESAVDIVREKTPPTLLPVIESMLAEIGGLGFIGLFLQMSLNSGIGTWIGQLSEEFLGEEDILLENFEVLHSSFFQVGIGFFAVSGIIVTTVLSKLRQIRRILGIEPDENGECTATTPANLADILNAPVVDAQVEDFAALEQMYYKQQNFFLKDLSMDIRQRGAEFLVIRRHFLDEHQLSDDFRLDIENLFARYLKELVKLSPLVWFALFPALTVGNALDLSHEVINVASPNALESSGYFLSTPSVWYPTLLWQVVSFGLCVQNFCKMATIKSMMMPNLVRDAKTGETRLLPPGIENKALLETFDSTPAIIKPIETFFGEAAKTRHDRLFGAAGAAGPELYLTSIKAHTWLAVSSIVFFATEIIPRDLEAVLNPGLKVGDPDHLVPELVAFSVFVASSFFQLSLTPTTFLNYCLVNFGKDKIMEEAVDELIGQDPDLLIMETDAETTNENGTIFKE